jgi:hypothetical protein
MAEALATGVRHVPVPEPAPPAAGAVGQPVAASTVSLAQTTVLEPSLAIRPNETLVLRPDHPAVRRSPSHPGREVRIASNRSVPPLDGSLLHALASEQVVAKKPRPGRVPWR